MRNNPAITAIDSQGIRLLLDKHRAFVLHMLATTSRHIPGDVAEIGVFQGGSAALILQATTQPLHLFDTFTGIPSVDMVDGGSHQTGDFACSLEAVRSNLNNSERLRFHQGDVRKGLGGFKEPLAFVHCDVDNYDGIVACIQHFWPLISPGGIMLFDDYRWTGTPGVEPAVKRHFKDRDIFSMHAERSFSEFEGTAVWSDTLVTSCWVIK